MLGLCLWLRCSFCDSLASALADASSEDFRTKGQGAAQWESMAVTHASCNTKYLTLNSRSKCQKVFTRSCRRSMGFLLLLGPHRSVLLHLLCGLQDSLRFRSACHCHLRQVQVANHRLLHTCVYPRGDGSARNSLSR